MKLQALEQQERGPRARTRRLMMETATSLMQSGVTPSISDVADAAEVSRATAYRYFPSQSALVEDVINEALGPILDWSSTSQDAEERVLNLFETSLPRIDEFEATFRAALKLSLETWGSDQGAADKTGQAEEELNFKRGHRIGLLSDALSPLRTELSGKQFNNLVQALSLIFGVESLIVLKDISGQSPKQILSLTQWMASNLIRAAKKDAENDRKHKSS